MRTLARRGDVNATQPSMRALLRPHLAPAVVFAVALAATLVSWRYVDAAVMVQTETRFRELTAESTMAVRERMEAYGAMLLAARGFFLGLGKEPDAATFRTFVSSLELEERYPGIQGIGWAKRLAPAEVAWHVQAERARGRPDYRVWPEGERDVYSAIVHLEPPDWRNRRAIGFDMYSEETRREAMARAAATGELSATRKVELVQELGEVRQAGFLMYLPVYRERVATPAEREASLRGWIYAPFRAADLLRAAVGDARARAVGLTVYDGSATTPEALLFGELADKDALWWMVDQIDLAGRVWTLRYAGAPAFASKTERVLPWAVLAGGILLSLLLSWITFREVRARVELARLYAQATRALRERDDFLSVASHELRTPLTSLLLQSQSLRAKAVRSELPELAKRAEVIRRNVERLSALVASLLDLTRITAGRLDLELEDVDLAELAAEVVARFEDEAARAGSELVLEGEGPVVGRWDRLRLDQVVTNLVSNAIKYGRGKPVVVRVAAAGDRAVLTVKDQGIGISGENQHRIFERFERAVSERNYGGFGLGLWIVRQIVGALGGTVRVESAEGEGATFTVELARATPAQQPGEPDTAQRS
jgi:signal transduction histidine kinase